MRSKGGWLTTRAPATQEPPPHGMGGQGGGMGNTLVGGGQQSLALQLSPRHSSPQDQLPPQSPLCPKPRLCMEVSRRATYTDLLSII